MDSWLLLNITVFVSVVLITGFIIPQILLIAFRKNLYDKPDPRKIHKYAVPRLGGIAFFPAILFTMMLAFGLIETWGDAAAKNYLINTLLPFCFIVSSVVIIYLVGMADDLVGVKFRAKFVAQFAAAALLIMGGIELDQFNGLFWIYGMPKIISVLFTALLVVFITNAINLIDGIDGLASGLSAIACICYGYICYKNGLYIYSMLGYATLGALLPFFCYNVFGNAKKHSKIFMGDTGALTIGLILSVLSIRICQNTDMVFSMNPTVVAFAPLLIPCFDVVRVYLHRIRAGQSPFLPDKNHIHHKLLALGMPQRVAMPTIVGVSLIVTVLNYIASTCVNITLLFVIDLLVWILANIALNRAISKRNKKLGGV